MKYYLHFDGENKIVGCSNLPTICQDYECREVSKEDYDAYQLGLEEKQNKLSTIKQRLDQLSQDFVQLMAGAVFEDLEARKQEFQSLHNELRILEGKEPRNYAISVDNTED